MAIGSDLKQLHATQGIPMLILNPGKQREKIVRLFCTKKSKNGKRIPLFSHKEITQVSSKIGNLDTLSAVLRIDGNQEIYVILNKNGGTALLSN